MFTIIIAITWILLLAVVADILACCFVPWIAGLLMMPRQRERERDCVQARETERRCCCRDYVGCGFGCGCCTSSFFLRTGSRSRTCSSGIIHQPSAGIGKCSWHLHTITMTIAGTTFIVAIFAFQHIHLP